MKYASDILCDMANSGSDNPKEAIQEYETALGAYNLHIFSNVELSKAMLLMNKYRRSINDCGSFLLADEAMNGISLLLNEHPCQSLLDMPLSEYRELIFSAATQDMQTVLDDYT